MNKTLILVVFDKSIRFEILNYCFVLYYRFVIFKYGFYYLGYLPEQRTNIHIKNANCFAVQGDKKYRAERGLEPVMFRKT